MKFKAISCALTLLLVFNFSHAEDEIEGESGSRGVSSAAPAATPVPSASPASPAAASVEEDLRDRVPDPKAPKVSAPEKSINVGMSEAEQKVKQEKMEKGHPENDRLIKEECNKIPATLPGFGEQSKYNIAAKNLITACETYISSKLMCDKTAAVAANGCWAGSSVELGTVVSAVQAIATAASFTIQDSCGMAAKAMDTIQKGASAYAVVCGGTTAICHKTCGKSTEGLVQFKAYLAEAGKIMRVKCTEADLNPAEAKKVQSTRQGVSLSVPLESIATECSRSANELESIVNNLQKPVLEELDVNDPGAVAGKEKICKIDFNKMVMAAGVSVAALVQGYFKANQCKKSTASQPAPLNCDDPANQSVPECICRKSPRSQGCSNALVKAGSTGTPVAASVIAKPELGTRSGLGPEGSTVGRDPAGVAEKSQSENVGGAQAGAPVGGGGGGGGAGGGSTGQNGGREMPGTQKLKGFNSNVMGGYEGGGGGGSRGGFRSEADARKALANYRNSLSPVKVAAQAWSKEVTPQAGRSNFEKVKARYNDNRRTLRGE